ncbi:DUF3857 domain-containing protein [Mucilaginibacter sp. RS28]|uniref:DUF3857 domain-containing protein n=1 Tax=Mucilaginibacter straminoryzae TaxID=2932774 RepID=A0A9X1X471_9SPHI|nr:DUF3857 domain-containing protein [Mucilaginibacter straminoryzae]MCJ8210877.1 DUF3857 domain-containing protein [Mucilaginibacter straminoryzae]
MKPVLRFFSAAVFAVLIAFGGNSAFADSDKLPKELYLAATIPDSLKTDANAVVRYSSHEYVVKGPGRAVIKVHNLVTILNEKGDEHAALVLYYQRKYNSVGSIEMKVYNAAGTLLKKYGKSDMYDRAAIDESTAVTDDRYLALEHTISGYPVTVETSYELSMGSFVDLSSWDIQPEETAVQTAVCKVSADPSVGFRYKVKNIVLKPQLGDEDGLKTYRFEVKNLKAFKPEEDVPDWRVEPRVDFAVDKFEFFGMQGEFNNWQNYGKLFYKLNADVNSLSPEREAEIRAMTANLKTDKEKARFLYNYLQQNMRYVSIQLGIGGFKPFPATFVDQKKYGDCKALSNYMYALLKAVNIPANYAVVNAGTNREPADFNFPADPFNHVILCIPFKNDTTWLECTSNTQPFGKLGTFTENRRALLITENGGKLVNTPASTLADNWFDSDVHLMLNPEGGATANVKIKGTGEYHFMYVGMARQKIDDQKEFLIKYLNLKQPSVFDFTASDDHNETKELDLKLEYDKFVEMAVGNKQFYRPRVFDLWRLTLPALEKRKYDFYFEHPMKKTCTTTIDLPQGFEPESVPANVNLKFTYGNFEITYQYIPAKNQVISKTAFNLTAQQIPAAKYNEMQQYMDDISRALNKKLVIRRKAS